MKRGRRGGAWPAICGLTGGNADSVLCPKSALLIFREVADVVTASECVPDASAGTCKFPDR